MARETKTVTFGQAEITLSIDVDKNAFEDWAKAGDQMAKHVENLGDRVDGLKNRFAGLGAGLSGLTKTLIGAGAAIGAYLTGGKLISVTKELQKDFNRFDHFVGRRSRRIAEEIANTYNLSFKEARKMMTELAQLLDTVGIHSPQAQERISKQLIGRARDVAGKTGESFEEVYSQFKDFIKGGDVGAIANTLGIFEERARKQFETQFMTILKSASLQDRPKIFHRYLMQQTKQFEGFYQRMSAGGGDIETNIDRAQANISNAMEEIFKTLIPIAARATNALADFTEKLPDAADAIADFAKKIKSMVSGVFEKAASAGEIIREKGSAAITGAGEFAQRQLDKTEIDEGIGQIFSQGVGRAKSFGEGAAEKTKDLFNKLLEKVRGADNAAAAQKGAAAAAPVTNNFKIAVHSNSADPMAVAKQVEKTFDHKFRAHLGTQTSGVIS